MSEHCLLSEELHWFAQGKCFLSSIKLFFAFKYPLQIPQSSPKFEVLLAFPNFQE